MRLLIVFTLFFATEYLLKTFVDAYKYNTTGFFLEFLPLFFTSVVGALICKEFIQKEKFIRIYLKLCGASITGYAALKAYLFVQWYWFLHPEYRELKGDINVGFAFTVFFFLVGSLVILVSYLVVMKIIILIDANQQSK
jgi:hypothetical protein